MHPGAADAAGCLDLYGSGRQYTLSVGQHITAEIYNQTWNHLGETAILDEFQIKQISGN